MSSVCGHVIVILLPKAKRRMLMVVPLHLYVRTCFKLFFRAQLRNYKGNIVLPSYSERQSKEVQNARPITLSSLIFNYAFFKNILYLNHNSYFQLIQTLCCNFLHLPIKHGLLTRYQIYLNCLVFLFDQITLLKKMIKEFIKSNVCFS